MITAKYDISHAPRHSNEGGEISRLLYACVPEGIVSGFLIAPITAAIAYLFWGKEAPTLVAEALIVLVGWIAGFGAGFVAGLICAYCERE
jgi:hypothetical protein